MDIDFGFYKTEKTRQTDKEISKSNSLKKKYGITLEDYRILFRLQNGKCQICEKQDLTDIDGDKKWGNLCVDHCHKTGNARGLLCNSCNIGLGLFKDNTELLLKAINYLNNNKDPEIMEFLKDVVKTEFITIYKKPDSYDMRSESIEKIKKDCPFPVE